MIVKPIKKKVLVAQNKQEQVSASGIILDTATSTLDSKTGTVLAIGPDVTLVEVGDRILLDWSKATMVQVGDDQRVVIDEDNIVAVLEK